jgi:hypothetical protein
LDEAITASARLSAASVKTEAAISMLTILDGKVAERKRPGTRS